MGVGPEHTRPQHSLFDRIATEHATADITAELRRTVADLPGDAFATADAETIDDSGPNAIVLGRSDHWPAPDISTQMDRPRMANRQCSRSGCSDAAAFTLSYHYGQSQVWIDRLWPEREPHMYDMCEQHAARLSVPRGWHLDDRRGARLGALVAV